MVKSCGNIFKDIGFNDVEAESLHIRSLLMLEIESYIKQQGLTQVEAAKQFNVTPSSVEKLISGKLDFFTIDALVNMLARVGIHMEIVVQQKAA